MSISTSTSNFSTFKGKPQYWFKKYAETVPVQYLPSAVLGEIRRVLGNYRGTKEQVREIRRAIEVYDDIVNRS